MEARADNVRSLGVRRRLRLSYGCDCNRDNEPGRVSASITNNVLKVVKNWTGLYPAGCPWRAFYDPFVRRVLDGYEWFDKGQLSTFEASPSNRLLEGITHYHRVLGSCKMKRMEQEREKHRRESERK